MSLVTKTLLLILLLWFQGTRPASAQTTKPAEYPKISAYVGFVHPLITVKHDETQTNLQNAYVIGMPVGINIWKTASIAFSLEFVPYIRATNSTSNMSNFLFHPGLAFRFKSGYGLAARMAFETSGRYGLTPVLNKTVVKGKNSAVFVAVPIPIRVESNQSTSIGAGLQVGLAF